MDIKKKGWSKTDGSEYVWLGKEKKGIQEEENETVRAGRALVMNRKRGCEQTRI